MSVIRRANIDDINVFAFDQLAPVGFDRFVAPLFRERLRLVGAAAQTALRTGL